MKRKFELHLQDAPLSDQLSALAKAAEINIVVDATQLPATSKLLSVNEQYGTLTWILNIANEQKLTWRRTYGTRTVLFWSRPDIVATAKALVNQAQENRNNSQPQGPSSSRVQSLISPQQRLNNVSELTTLLADYLQTAQGWDRKTNNLRLSLQLSQLPPNLQDKLLAAVRTSFATATSQGSEIWLSDEFWKSARLSIVSSPGKQPSLTVSGQVDGRALTHNLGSLQPRALQAMLLTPIQSRVVASALESPGVAPVAATDTASLVNPPESGADEQSGSATTILAADIALAAKVSLASTGLSLPDALQELQKQSGIKIALAPDSALTQKRVMIFAHEMPMSEMMDALASLYVTSWSKNPDGGYVLLNSKISPAQQQMVQLGDLNWLDYWQTRARPNMVPRWLTVAQPIDWEAEILESGQSEAFNSPQGVAISALPAPLQEQVRHDVETPIALGLIRSHFSKVLALNEAITLRVEPSTFVAYHYRAGHKPTTPPHQAFKS